MNHVPPGLWLAQYLPVWTTNESGQPPEHEPNPPGRDWRKPLGKLLTALGCALAEWGAALKAPSLPTSRVDLARNCGGRLSRRAPGFRRRK